MKVILDYIVIILVYIVITLPSLAFVVFAVDYLEGN